MKIKRTITINLTDEEALDFATHELNYQAILERSVPVVDDETTDPVTTHFEIETYDNPISVEETITSLVDTTLEGTVANLLSAYKNRKKEELVAGAKLQLETAEAQVLEALDAHQAEVITIA